MPALKPPTVSVAELATELASGRAPTIIDIRDERDYTRAHLRGARCVQPEHLEEELRKLGSAARVVLVCRTGERSKAEAARLAELGLPVVSLEKGLLEWQGANKPTYSTREEQELEAQA
ncbi:rhodanese-like domain-containing protein [Myxococcota bacterium]|nr:rhodanese-like domain-containing protein [Myxococcota bacterium]